MALNSHEEGFIRSFILAKYRQRWREFLANKKPRPSFLFDLQGSRAIAYAYSVPVKLGEAESLALDLFNRGAIEPVWVISAWKHLDAQSLPLLEALEKTLGQGLGTVISCSHGKLAFYEGDGIRCRWILTK